MDNPVPRGRRRIQSVQTRELIVATAGELFLANGYTATSIEAIATQAGVAIQTIYNSVGNKPALLSAVLDAAVAGPHPPSTVPEFMRERVALATDVPGVVGVLADWFAELAGRDPAAWHFWPQMQEFEASVSAVKDNAEIVSIRADS